MFKMKGLQFARHSTDLNLLTGGKQDDWKIQGAILFNALKTKDIIFKFYNLRTKKTVDSIDYREPYFIKACVRVWNLLEYQKQYSSSYDHLFNLYEGNDSLSWMFNNTIFTNTLSFSLSSKTRELSEIYDGIFSKKEIEDFIISLSEEADNNQRQYNPKNKQAFEEAVNKGFNPNLIIFCSDYIKSENGLIKRTEGNEIIHSHELSIIAMTKYSWSYTNAEKLTTELNAELKRHHVRNHHHLAFLMKQDTLDDLRKIYELNEYVDFRVIYHKFIDDELNDVLNFVNERLLKNRKFVLTCPWFKDPTFISEFIEHNAFNSVEYIEMVPTQFIKSAIKKDKSILLVISNLVSECLGKIKNISRTTYYNLKTLLSFLPNKFFTKNLLQELIEKSDKEEEREPLHVHFFNKFTKAARTKYQEEIFKDFPRVFQYCTEEFQAIEDNYMKAAQYGTYIDFKKICKEFDFDLYIKVMETLSERDSILFGVEKKHVHSEFVDFLDAHGIQLAQNGRIELIIIDSKHVEELKILHRKERLEAKLAVKGTSEKKLKI